MEREELNAAASAVADAMKAPVPVREEWRDRLLSEIERDVRARAWSVRPWVAIAACLVCVALGAVGTRLLMRGTATVATQTRPAAVRFVFVAPGASKVSVVGDFNQWKADALPLRRLSDGRTWIADLPLAPGRYAYAFVVDGKIEADPNAPRATGDDFGVVNSILMVRGL